MVNSADLARLTHFSRRDATGEDTIQVHFKKGSQDRTYTWKTEGQSYFSFVVTLIRTESDKNQLTGTFKMIEREKESETLKENDITAVYSEGILQLRPAGYHTRETWFLLPEQQ